MWMLRNCRDPGALVRATRHGAPRGIPCETTGDDLISVHANTCCPGVGIAILPKMRAIPVWRIGLWWRSAGILVLPNKLRRFVQGSFVKALITCGGDAGRPSIPHLHVIHRLTEGTGLFFLHPALASFHVCCCRYDLRGLKRRGRPLVVIIPSVWANRISRSDARGRNRRSSRDFLLSGNRLGPAHLTDGAAIPGR